MWTCTNGHGVRDGMFVCSRCGTDQAADPDRPVAVPSPPDRDGLRVAARQEIASRTTTGVGLVLLGFLLAAVSVAVAGADAATAAVVVSLLAYLAGLIGLALVLVGIVGHGVRLGIDAAGGRRTD